MWTTALWEMALGLGAAGYAPEDAGREELRTAIEEVLGGRRYVSPKIPKHGHRGGNAARVGFLRLTPRQQELVRMIGRGLSSAQMAEATGLSHWTIDFHRKNIRKVLGTLKNLPSHPGPTDAPAKQLIEIRSQ
jgi:DNA-binding NarL/FixJ family response regulator